MDAAASPTIDANEVFGLLLQIENASYPSAIKNKKTVMKYTKIPAFDLDSKGDTCPFPRLRRMVTLEDSPVKTSRSLKAADLPPPAPRMIKPNLTKRKIVTIEEDDENDYRPAYARSNKVISKATETDLKRDAPNSRLSTSRLSNSTNLREKRKISKSFNKVAEIKVSNDEHITQNSVSRITKISKYSRESKSSAKNIISSPNRKESNSPKVIVKSRYLNNSQTPIEVAKSQPVKETPLIRPKSAKIPPKVNISKNQDPPRQSGKDVLLYNKRLSDNVKINTTSKKPVVNPPLSKFVNPPDPRNEKLLRELNRHKHVTVIHVPLEKTIVSKNELQIASIHATNEVLNNKADSSTETDNNVIVNDVTILTTLPVATKDKEIQMGENDIINKEDSCKRFESLSIQTDFINETFDSLAVPNVTLTKDKSGTKENIFKFQSSSLPNLHVPSLKITQHRSEESESSNICKGSYFIGHATVTCTTRQEIDFHVVGNSSENISNQSPSPLAYPLNVVSIFEKEMKRQKQHDKSVEQRKSNVQYTKSLNELQSVNCSYALESNKLVKPSDIISTININHGLLQNEYICEQFQRELNFIDSFFESLQYLESCSLTDACISEKKVENLINNPDFDVNHTEYGSFISKLENGANVDDSETMASKSLCLLNLLIRDEQRRAKNLLFVLKMREDALKDFTKSQILWLENKKRQENTDISTLKKKQRGALLKLQHECGEMQRMRKALLTQSEKRKVALMKTKKNIELKLKNNVDVDQIILGKKKLKRNISDRNTTPLKCFDLSSSGCEESSASKPKSDIPLQETSVVVSVSSAEKCIQTGESKLEIAQSEQSTDTAAENFVVVDGGYLNILFNNLSVPEIFSSSKQYEVNEEALRNIVSSTNSKQNFNESDMENLVNQIRNTDMESSSPSTARSLVEEMDQYYKGLVEEKLPVQCLHSERGMKDPPQPCSNRNYSLCTLTCSNVSVCEKEERQFVYEPVSDNVCDMLVCEEVIVSATPTGPLPVPAGTEALVPDTTVFPNVDSSSSSASDIGSVSSQPHIASRTSMSTQCEAEELRRQQLAIEREIKALEQQQSQLLVVREIPDKPPPPYTPPTDARSPRLPRKYVADETTEEKIQKYMRNPDTDSCDPTDAFDTFVKDFCIETLEKHTLESSEKPWDACNLLPQKPPEDTEKLIKNTSSSLLDILTGVGPVIVSGVGARRSDHIDDVLFAEWRRCEPEWTSLQTDEAYVKNQIFEGIFQKILTETIDEYKRTVLCDQ